MAVDSTNMEALFEKLKVEDPWLPPSTWESIPSQNAARFSSSFSHPSMSSSSQPLFTSTLSEASLVGLALNALQGVQSALLSIEKLYDAFRSDPADRTHHKIPSLWYRSSSTYALGKILNSIGCSGSLVFLLHRFVENFMDLNSNTCPLRGTHENDEHCNSNTGKEERPSYSLVNQAFAVAVGKVLEGYVCALDTLHASVRLRRSSSSVVVDSLESYGVACLTSVVHSEVTLLEVYLHTKELRTQIEVLGNICSLHTIALNFSVFSFEELTAKASKEFSKFYRGGDLLTYLYTLLQVADPAHCALLKFLFLRSCEPYCGFIRAWIFKAEINDPYNEFLVEYAHNQPPYLHCKADMLTVFPLASFRKQDEVAVPCFLKDFVIPIIRAGQQLQVLKKLLELYTCAGASDCTYEDFLPNWSGYLINDLFCASPITFTKEYLEAMVIARNNYYRKMQEKLKNLLTRLELRFLQVVPDSVAHIIIDNADGGLQTAVSFTSNERADNIDSDNSDVEDEFHVLDASESSECSSSRGSEEQTESGELVDHANSSLACEQRYLSSLRFSTSSPVDISLQRPAQRNRSHDMASNVHENYETIDACGSLMQPFHDKRTSNHLFAPFGSEEPNWPCMSGTQCMDGQTDKYRTVGLSGSLFHNCKETGFHDRLHEYKQAQKLSNTDTRLSKEGVSYFSKMTSSKDVLLGESLVEDPLENSTYISNSFTLQRWKLDYHCNFFSANPVLRKNAYFHQVREAGEERGTAHGSLFPCFDFSTVEDPFKVSVEELASNLGHEFGSLIPSNVTNSFANHNSNNKSKQGYGKDDVLIENTKESGIHQCLYGRKHDQDVDVSTSVCGGSSWQSLLGNFNYSNNESVGDNKENLSAMFEIPLDFIVDKCLLQEIMLQYKYVSKLTIKLLEEGFGLQEHLLALRRYYFMELADWADLFIMSLWHHKWSITEADQRIPQIQGLLELSIQRSSCQQDPYKDRLFVYIKGNSSMPVSISAIGVHSFNFLGLGYRVDWPVNIVLTPSALKIYAEIFSFLMQVKLAVFSLNNIWCSLKDLMHLVARIRLSTSHKREVGYFYLLVKMRHQIYHFISTLQQYVHSQLSHVSWCKFFHLLKYKVKDMMDLERVHNGYLTDALYICFLSNDMQSVASNVKNILQCALDFRSCLTSNTWDVGFDQGELLCKLSKINMSQVLAIKQKFDENLKELHLCYLKSPKHGEFGLSHFWTYLNYNDCYSELGNRSNLYAF